MEFQRERLPEGDEMPVGWRAAKIIGLLAGCNLRDTAIDRILLGAKA